MSRRWLVAALYLALLGAFAAGVWASYRAAFPGAGLYRVTGVLEARYGDTRILIRHETVPGLMEEMDLMSLDVEFRELLDAADLRRGDRIRLTVRQLPDRLLVTEIRKLP